MSTYNEYLAKLRDAKGRVLVAFKFVKVRNDIVYFEGKALRNGIAKKRYVYKQGKLILKEQLSLDEFSKIVKGEEYYCVCIKETLMELEHED